MTIVRFMELAQLDSLISELAGRGYLTVGPTMRQGAICYDRIDSASDLPRGWTDTQAPGVYRIQNRNDGAYFGYSVGPHSWKQFLFPPTSMIAHADKGEHGWQVTANEGASEPKYALIGVRACELAAIAIQDKVFLNSQYTDPIYAARRRNAFLVAVNCTQFAATCFCESMHTGPRCTQAFDLALTELTDGFVVEIATEEATSVMQAIATRNPTAEELNAAQQRRQGATGQSRKMPSEQARDIVMRNLQHPRWHEVAQRCLSCSNCTQVCPTCFCSSVTEVTDLDIEHVQRQRSWDSCFNMDFSYMHGGVVRNSIRSRYRQWLTHKLGTWHDQFDTSGCVGCGRCITWCPVGIDITEEVAALNVESP